MKRRTPESVMPQHLQVFDPADWLPENSNPREFRRIAIRQRWVDARDAWAVEHGQSRTWVQDTAAAIADERAQMARERPPTEDRRHG